MSVGAPEAFSTVQAGFSCPRSSCSYRHGLACGAHSTLTWGPAGAPVRVRSDKTHDERGEFVWLAGTEETGLAVVWEPPARLELPGAATTRLEDAEVQIELPGEPQVEEHVRELENTTRRSSWI